MSSTTLGQWNLWAMAVARAMSPFTSKTERAWHLLNQPPRFCLFGLDPPALPVRATLVPVTRLLLMLLVLILLLLLELPQHVVDS